MALAEILTAYPPDNADQRERLARNWYANPALSDLIIVLHDLDIPLDLKREAVRELAYSRHALGTDDGRFILQLLSENDATVPLIPMAIRAGVRIGQRFVPREGGVTTLLTRAVSGGNVDEVAGFLALGAEINENAWGVGTPLETAVRRENRGMLDFLLAHGADPNIGNPLLEAVKGWDTDILLRLLAEGADPQRVPGDEAAEAASLDTLVAFLDNTTYNPERLLREAIRRFDLPRRTRASVELLQILRERLRKRGIALFHRLDMELDRALARR